MTCGPYRPITLRTYSTRIQGVYPRTYSDPSITLKVDIELDGRPWDIKAIFVSLKLPGAEAIQSERRLYDTRDQVRYVKLDNLITWYELQQKGVELWWPFSYGKQPLYDLEVTILGTVSISWMLW